MQGVKPEDYGEVLYTWNTPLPHERAWMTARGKKKLAASKVAALSARTAAGYARAQERHIVDDAVDVARVKKTAAVMSAEMGKLPVAKANAENGGFSKPNWLDDNLSDGDFRLHKKRLRNGLCSDHEFASSETLAHKLGAECEDDEHRIRVRATAIAFRDAPEFPARTHELAVTLLWANECKHRQVRSLLPSLLPPMLP